MMAAKPGPAGAHLDAEDGATRHALRGEPPRAAGDPRAPVVWFVNQYAGSPVHGMEFRHYEIGRALAASGYRVVIVSGSYSHLYATRPTTSGTYSIEDVDGLTYCWVKVPPYQRSISVGRVINMLAFMARLYRLPLRRLPAPDAIVVSSPSLFPILPAARWSRSMQARLLLEVRDVWPLTLQELGGLSSYHPLILVMRWFEKRAYRVAAVVVSVLPAARSHLESSGMDPQKLRIIPNGVSPDALVEAAGPTPTHVLAAAGRHAFNVGFVGTLGRANALDTLIEAARLLAGEGIGFVIVGQGPEEARLRTLVADLDNVSMVGPVAKRDVPATLKAFDACYVGYHPSPLYRFGISPNKVFDYMAASRPVILAASAANDPVRDAQCGLTVEPGDPAALAQAIRSLRSAPPAERARMGSNGRAYVERVHSYPGLAALYAPLLDPAAR
jgi:glycosyltransferase involved in cell wall biosynthesis